MMSLISRLKPPSVIPEKAYRNCLSPSVASGTSSGKKAGSKGQSAVLMLASMDRDLGLKPRSEVFEKELVFCSRVRN